MFKKLKDKLAEEVKSSPQRLHQFAQAAQAAVTSASSSISDITNNDLFSIGDNDVANKSPISTPNTKLNPGTSFGKPESMNVSLEAPDFSNDNQRLRRLSNSSFSSDISFRLPSYESPSMYHLQSDMEVSASEAEEKSPFGGNVNLDRVSKEQLYSAYRRTQDRCKKYKTQYSDLARHYKLLERENAKARNVLVETQDKALRRISELREQCSLEQSAKAHLEQVLRTEIEEKNMKIESLNANLNILKSSSVLQTAENLTEPQLNIETEAPLINFDKENTDSLPNDVTVLNAKIEKMEQLLNKYKESLKVAKEKNSQLKIEVNKIATDLDHKSKENEAMQAEINVLSEAKKKLEELSETIEELRNKNNALEFQKKKELSIVEINLKNAQEEILNYKSKIDVLGKREEEYAISLAENKLSIHKELESKETEIKALKISLSSVQSEVKNLEKKTNEYKTVIEDKEKECSQLKTSLNELEMCKARISEYETQLEALSEKLKILEHSNSKLEEEYKCLHLQLKQETAEKLAMIDRNTYLENRNEQLTEDNNKKNNKVKDLENELSFIKDNKNKSSEPINNSEVITKLNDELLLWKNKCTNLESEFQDEKIELGKLQAEIEKLLLNYEHVQKENMVMTDSLEQVKAKNRLLENKITNTENLKYNLNELKPKFEDLRYVLKNTAGEVKALKSLSSKEMDTFNKQLSTLVQHFNQNSGIPEVEKMKSKLATLEKELQDKSQQYSQIVKELENAKKMHQDLLAVLEEQKIIHREEIRGLKAENCNIETELLELKKQSEMLQNSASKVSAEKQILLEDINKLQNNYTALSSNFKILEDEKNQLKMYEIECDKIKSNQAILEKELQNKSEQHLQIIEELENAKKAHEKVLVEMKKHNSNNLKYDGEIKALTEEKCKIEYELKESKKQLEILNNNFKKSDIEKQLILEELDKIKEKHSMLSTNVKALKDEKKYLTEVHEKNIVLLKDTQGRLVSLNNDYEDLLKIKQDNDKQTVYAESLEKEIKMLTKENLSLKESSEKISKNLDEIETEMKELKISHINIVKEKDHLNNIIEKLEENNNKSYEHKESQSDSRDLESELNKNVKNVEALKLEIKSLLQINKELNEKLTIKDSENVMNKNDDLLTECDFLRKENKRLLSDIEGLQTYMSKVSKENDELNNKIRELISNGETTTEQIDVLKDDTHSNEEKIEELLRENSILIEENLELKDQIQSHSLQKHDLDEDIEKNSTKNKDEHEQWVKRKTELENRLRDLEEMNYRVNSDMIIMQDNNKKLKLSNEKLERKLDEALVSLRHLHSLQENTELEYLKNILYEYLTGSGTHSYTLAKVLAAVVKFDDKQTDTVLQKEKERQGVLRQLGII